MLSQIDNKGKTNYTVLMSMEDNWHIFHLFNTYEDNEDMIVGTKVLTDANLVINSDLPNAIIVLGKEKVVGLSEPQPFHAVVNGNYVIYYHD